MTSYVRILCLPSTPRPHQSTGARTSVDVAQVGRLLSLSWSPFSGTPSEATPRQAAVTRPPPFVLDDDLRKLLGTNPNLSDNKLIKSWQYALWMISYCVACTLFGVLSVTLLPDPKTLELIRGGGGDDDMMMEAQSMAGAYQAMEDTNGQGHGTMEVSQDMMGPYRGMEDTNGQGHGTREVLQDMMGPYRGMEAFQNMMGPYGGMEDTDGLGHREMEASQNIVGSYGGMEDTTGSQESYKHVMQDIRSSSAHDNKAYVGSGMQDSSVQASEETGKKRPSKGYHRYKGTTEEPTKNYYDQWVKFYNEQKNSLKASAEKQRGGEGPPSSHYRGVHSEESSYTSYAPPPS